MSDGCYVLESVNLGASKIRLKPWSNAVPEAIHRLLTSSLQVSFNQRELSVGLIQMISVYSGTTLHRLDRKSV